MYKVRVCVRTCMHACVPKCVCVYVGYVHVSAGVPGGHSRAPDVLELELQDAVSPHLCGFWEPN